jgi:hypothetical protein
MDNITIPPEQIEAVARALAVANGTREDSWRFYEGKAIAGINAMRPFIRAEVLKEAAVNTAQVVIRDSIAAALRGAAVMWRPVSDVPPYRHVIVWVPASAGRNGHIRHNTIWCADENKWVDENYDALEVQPTHFIPISALGEPTND